MKTDLKVDIEIPQGVNVATGPTLTIKGPNGEVSRLLNDPRITITLEGNTLRVAAPKATKREKTLLGTYQSHIGNMIKGVTEGFVYELKICSGHFPMTVTVSGQELTIKNFLGENHPRKTSIPQGVTVKVEGDKILVESSDKELAGQTAARIENLTTVRGRDIRIFQDGCYIINKAGKVIG